MAFKNNLNPPTRFNGNFLDEPIEKGQVSLRWYQFLEQLADNFTATFNANGNVVLDVSGRPINPEIGVVIIDSALNIPIWFDGTDWRNFAGTIV